MRKIPALLNANAAVDTEHVWVPTWTRCYPYRPSNFTVKSVILNKGVIKLKSCHLQAIKTSNSYSKSINISRWVRIYFTLARTFHVARHLGGTRSHLGSWHTKLRARDTPRWAKLRPPWTRYCGRSDYTKVLVSQNRNFTASMILRCQPLVELQSIHKQSTNHRSQSTRLISNHHLACHLRPSSSAFRNITSQLPAWSVVPFHRHHGYANYCAATQRIDLAVFVILRGRKQKGSAW